MEMQVIHALLGGFAGGRDEVHSLGVTAVRIALSNLDSGDHQLGS